MGPGICFPLLSTRGNLDADGSQITGKEFVPEPPGGCGWTSENGKKASAFELWEWQAESTASAGEGDHSNSSYVLSTWHAPDFRLRLATTPILRMRKLRL